jgi:hypothetical protein
VRDLVVHAGPEPGEHRCRAGCTRRGTKKFSETMSLVELFWNVPDVSSTAKWLTPSMNCVENESPMAKFTPSLGPKRISLSEMVTAALEPTSTPSRFEDDTAADTIHSRLTPLG